MYDTIRSSQRIDTKRAQRRSLKSEPEQEPENSRDHWTQGRVIERENLGQCLEVGATYARFTSYGTTQIEKRSQVLVPTRLISNVHSTDSQRMKPSCRKTNSTSLKEASLPEESSSLNQLKSLTKEKKNTNAIQETKNLSTQGWRAVMDNLITPRRKLPLAKHSGQHNNNN